ncbi:MAG: hypothetical protein AABX30_00470 [Nanoarchaeota archaeon]
MQIYKKKSAEINRFIFWTPRILAILFILFLAIFSLDVFDMDLSFWEAIAGLFIHNIPIIILLVILTISWKYEIVGAIAFILAGLLYIGIIIANIFMNQFEWYMVSYFFIITGPAFLVGILFYLNWKVKKKIKSKH